MRSATSRFVIAVCIMTVMSAAALTPVVVAVGPISGETLDDVTCKEALGKVPEIKIGMTDEQVLELLGRPTAVEKEMWGYNFWGCSPPPQIGSQMVIGLAIKFKDGVVSKIDYATVCAMGPGKRKKGR